MLSQNEISDLQALVNVISGNIPKLGHLYIAENRFCDITPLTALKGQLKGLNLDGIQISNLGPLAEFTNLTELYLRRTGIRDLSPLSGLTSLTRLELSSNRISNLEPLRNLTNLTRIFMDRNQVTDLEPLSGLTSLTHVWACWNPFPLDPNPFESLSKLTAMEDFSVDTTYETLAKGVFGAGAHYFCDPAKASLGGALQDFCPRPSETNPRSETETEPSVMGEQEPVSIYRSRVTQNPVIFNEILNAADDKNDWIELKNITDEEATFTDWELSIVNSEGENANKDVSLLTFGDYTLPAGGILLIVNTDPNETDLIRGQNIIDPESNPDAPPQYIIVPEMKLPDTPYMLILRNATNRKENGEHKPLFEVPEAFEDLAGNYFRSFADYGTQVWPLINTGRPPKNHTALLTPGQAWQRVDVDERGYTKEAWVLSGYQSGLGYKPLAPVETSLGTPGYASPSDVNVVSTGQISFSEVMYSTNSTVSSPSQWIELYNNSLTEVVNLRDWKLVIEARDSRFKHRYTVLVLNTLEVLPNQTVLLVTRAQRNSGNLPERRVYDLYAHHRDEEKRLGLRDNKVLGSEGFALKLLTPDDILVDIAGNMNGENGLDTPAWKLPSGWTEDGARTSLIRRYEGNVALDGTASTSWVRTVDTALMVAHVYWGSPTDNGTPGYKQGGILPVTLSHFRADRMESGVVLKWRTESEVENAGFNILRSQTRQGRYVKVNPSLIMGAGTISERHDYTWTDTTAKPNVSYYYRIEDVSFAGDRQQLATVRMRGLVSASGKLTTRWSDLKLQE